MAGGGECRVGTSGTPKFRPSSARPATNHQIRFRVHTRVGVGYRRDVADRGVRPTAFRRRAPRETALPGHALPLRTGRLGRGSSPSMPQNRPGKRWEGPLPGGAGREVGPWHVERRPRGTQRARRKTQVRPGRRDGPSWDGPPHLGLRSGWARGGSRSGVSEFKGTRTGSSLPRRRETEDRRRTGPKSRGGRLRHPEGGAGWRVGRERRKRGLLDPNLQGPGRVRVTLDPLVSAPSKHPERDSGKGRASVPTVGKPADPVCNESFFDDSPGTSGVLEEFSFRSSCLAGRDPDPVGREKMGGRLHRGSDGESVRQTVVKNVGSRHETRDDRGPPQE